MVSPTEEVISLNFTVFLRFFQCNTISLCYIHLFIILVLKSYFIASFILIISLFFPTLQLNIPKTRKVKINIQLSIGIILYIGEIRYIKKKAKKIKYKNIKFLSIIIYAPLYTSKLFGKIIETFHLITLPFAIL